jgi:hypothetical protein
MDAVELARAIGVELVGRFAHGEGTGAYAIRMPDGTGAVLKVETDDLDFGRSITFTDALRTRGYPAPASIASGELDGTWYEVTELVPGNSIEQVTADQVLQLIALNDLQRGPWLAEILASLTDGYVGYCELGPLRAYDPALLDRLQEIARRSRDLDIATGDVVHYDFSPYNILAEGDHITGVVDWTGATSGDAAFDLVTLAYYTYDFALRDQLLDAARTRTDPRALHLYAAHMVLRQVDWSLRHQDDTGVRWATDIGGALLEVLDG